MAIALLAGLVAAVPVMTRDDAPQAVGREFTSADLAPAASPVNTGSDIDAAFAAVHANVVDPTDDFDNWREAEPILAAAAVPGPSTSRVPLADPELGMKIGVTLPGDLSTMATSAAGSVYYDIFDSTDLVVQEQADGVTRFVTVIDGPAAPNTVPFRLELPAGTRAAARPDGSVFIHRGPTVVAHISAPWAYDVNGEPVPAWYDVDGTILALNVDHAAATAYPVVADPSWWWWSRNVAWCAAGIGSLAISYSVKTALTVSRIARMARNSQTFRIAMYRLGGAAGALKSLLQIIAAKVPVLSRIVGASSSSYKMRQLGLLIRQGMKWVVIGLIGGSCWEIGAELSPYW